MTDLTTKQKKVWMKRVKKTLIHDIIWNGTSVEINVDTHKSIKLEGTSKYDHKEYYCSCDSPGGTGFNCSICHKAIKYNWE